MASGTTFQTRHSRPLLSVNSRTAIGPSRVACAHE
jgi:hypothetical protein